MKIYGARTFHAVLFVKYNFGRNASNSGCNGRDRDLAQISENAIASQDDDGSRLIRRCKAIQPDLAAR